MGKVVVLKIGDGDFEHGFQVPLAIGEDGAYPFIESKGQDFPEPSRTILELARVLQY